MMQINFYLAGNIVKNPKNWKEILYEISWDKGRDPEQNKVTITDWEFVKDNADLINQWILDGLTGGVGVFEGIPFKVEVTEDGLTEVIFDGYLDLTNLTELSCDKTTVKAVEKQKIDWLNDVADSFTFEYLKDIGEINPTDYIFVPYVINSIPDYKEAMLCFISLFLVTNELAQAIEKISELAVEGSNPFEATAIVRTILFIVYLTSLLIALVKLISDLINYLIQPVKYHAGMEYKTLLEKGAQHLGLTLKTTLFDTTPGDEFIILPEKFKNPASPKKGIMGLLNPDELLTNGWYRGTFGDLLRETIELFNAKIEVTDQKELYILRRDETIGAPQFQLSDIDKRTYTINADEFRANYLVQLNYDLSDKNTIQDYEGNAYQAIIKPKVIGNADYLLMKGFRQRNIKFAKGRRKEEFTFPEELVLAFLDVFDGLVNGIIAGLNVVIDVINEITDVINSVIDALDFIGIEVDWKIEPINNIDPVDFSETIENRIGMLMLEGDYFTQPKLLMVQQGSQAKYNKINPLNAQYVNAKYFYENYHIVESFVPSQTKPNANQYEIWKFEKHPFCLKDFLKVKNNSFAYNAAGIEVELLSLKWNVFKQYADIDFRINKLYTNNLQETYLYPNGI